MSPTQPPQADHILAHLSEVQTERNARAADPAWATRVGEVKAYQQKRFAHTHADLLAHPRYGAAARFFLDDLYGPQDFAERDAQFARIVPALVRLFPADIVATAASLAGLHALSESLDSAMGLALGRCDPPVNRPLDAAAYAAAWRAVGRADDRCRQLDMVLAVGHQLDRFTRNRLLRQSLRVMRGPARAAGLGALQTFLERGFDTFGGMRGAEEFLALIAERERSLMAALFATESSPTHGGAGAALGQLP